MASYLPIIKNGANGAIFYLSLAPRTANGQWQSNPTLAGGDVKISLDGGALANLGTLPAVTPAASKLVKVTLSQAETNADNIAIVFSDAAGAEWCDLTVNLQTAAKQFDDLATQASVDAVQADTDNIQTRIPAALVSGRIDASVGAMTANVLTATAINADAITAAKIADGAIDAATFAAGAINAAAIAADAITDAKVASDVTIASVTGAVGSVAGNVGGNVTGSVGSVAAGGITAPSFAADAITAAKIAADVTTELQAGLATAASIAALNNLSAAQVNAEVDTAIADAALATAANLAVVAGYIDTEIGTIITNLATVDTVVDAIKVSTDKIDDTVEDDGGTYRFTANALEQAPTGGSAPTVGQIADEVQTRTIAAVTLVNGLAANSVTAAAVASDAVTEFQTGLATASALSTVSGKIDVIDDFLDTEVAAILADTNELQTDWANGGRLDNILDARASQTSVDDLPTNAELTTALATADDAVLAQVAMVRAKTDNLPSDPADQSMVIDATTAIMGRLGAPAGASVSADVAAVKDDTAAIKGKTDSMTFTVVDQLDVNMLSINGTALTGDGSTGDKFGPA